MSYATEGTCTPVSGALYGNDLVKIGEATGGVRPPQPAVRVYVHHFSESHVAVFNQLLANQSKTS